MAAQEEYRACLYAYCTDTPLQEARSFITVQAEKSVISRLDISIMYREEG